jgi:heat shock protein HtpX
VSAAEACPRCAEPLTALGFPYRWCPACEWNLDRVVPAVVGWKWADRRLHRLAYRLTARQFTALAEGPLDRRSTSAARLVTMAVAVVLIAAVLAVAGLGLWLLLFQPRVLVKGLGVLLLGLAFVLRPRLGRLAEVSRDTHPIERATAPELFGLVETVAREVDAPMPDVLLISYDQNAFTTTVGWRRTRVLCLGLPLWATLDPPERVALIGHEMGHFVNGDVRRGPLTAVAENTLGHLAELLAPSSPTAGGLVGMISRSVSWLLSRTAMTLQILLFWTSQRDSQRAEYLADELGARSGGTAAAIRLADHLLLATAIDTVIRREARAGHGMSAWRAAAVVARANQAPNVPLLRRLSRRTQSSLAASHPPNGLRAEMLERRPEQPAAVRLDDAASDRIDAELGRLAERVRRVLAQD